MNEKATLGLPLRMIVSIIVGGAALSTILYYIGSSCFYPEELQVNWQPSYIENGKDSVIIVEVKAKGHAIKDARVLIKGLGNAAYGETNESGIVMLHFTPHMPNYENEDYLSIEVKSNGCYKKFYQENAIKVVR